MTITPPRSYIMSCVGEYRVSIWHSGSDAASLVRMSVVKAAVVSTNPPTSMNSGRPVGPLRPHAASGSGNSLPL